MAAFYSGCDVALAARSSSDDDDERPVALGKKCFRLEQDSQYTLNANGYDGPQANADALIKEIARRRTEVRARARARLAREKELCEKRSLSQAHSQANTKKTPLHHSLSVLLGGQQAASATRTVIGLVDIDLFSPHAEWNFLWGWTSRGWASSRSDEVREEETPDVGILSLARGGGSQQQPWDRAPGLAHLLKHHLRLFAMLSLAMSQCPLARCMKHQRVFQGGHYGLRIILSRLRQTMM